MMHIQRVPIVHTTALEMLVRDGETERMDQMKTAFIDRAQSPDISGILRNLRIIEDDMEHLEV